MSVVELLIVWVVVGFVVAGLFGSLARLGRHPAEPEPGNPANSEPPAEADAAPPPPSQSSAETPEDSRKVVHVLPFDRSERRR